MPGTVRPGSRDDITNHEKLVILNVNTGVCPGHMRPRWQAMLIVRNTSGNVGALNLISGG